MMQNQLIMFAGSSPGAGKSTLSALLLQHLVADGIPTHWFYEEDIGRIKAFTHFLHDLTISYPKTDVFLDAATAFVQEVTALNKTVITDSFLPGYGFFFGNYPREQIEAFSSRLCHILQSLNPLVVYLHSDVETALMRAVEQRGTRWLERMMQRMNTWTLPLYEQKPFRTLQDVIAFDRQINQLNLALLSQWRGGSLILDTTNTPVAQLVTELLNALAVSEHPIQHHVDRRLLHKYIGKYVLHGDNSSGNQLDVWMVDGCLFVNTYWPNGTRLVAESDTRFRLQSTSRWIEFDLGYEHGPPGLVYVVDGQRHRYDQTVA